MFIFYIPFSQASQAHRAALADPAEGPSLTINYAPE